MSDFLSDRTVIGIGTTLVSVSIALWRRIRPSDGPSWYVRLARIGSAVLKQQAAEGALDTVKESLLLEREETAYLRQELRGARAEITDLRARLNLPPISPTNESSAPSNAGSTVSRRGRTRRKPTT